MQKISLDALSREQLAVATTATAQRVAHTVFGGHEHTLRQGQPRSRRWSGGGRPARGHRHDRRHEV